MSAVSDYEQWFATWLARKTPHENLVNRKATLPGHISRLEARKAQATKPAEHIEIDYELSIFRPELAGIDGAIEKAATELEHAAGQEIGYREALAKRVAEKSEDGPAFVASILAMDPVTAHNTLVPHYGGV